MFFPLLKSAFQNGSVERAVMLDWQIAYCTSPALDFVHFIFSCTDETLRAQHYDELLQLYYQSMKTLLDRLGGNAESQFPFSAFLDQLKQFGKFGVMMASVVIPGTSVKNEDLPARDLMGEGDENDDPEKLKEILTSMSGEVSDSVKQRIRAVLMDIIKYGYL